jgi:hypothetical protein
MWQNSDNLNYSYILVWQFQTQILNVSDNEFLILQKKLLTTISNCTSKIRETDRVLGLNTNTAILLVSALEEGRESMPHATQFPVRLRKQDSI